MSRIAALICACLFACAMVAGVASADGKPEAGLAIEDFKMFNGDAGFELWRLQATFGNIVGNGDRIDLDLPDVRYALGKPGDDDYVRVRSAKGRISDKQRIVELWDDVVVTRGREVLTSTYVRYDSRTRMMTFPKGVVVKGPIGGVTAEVMSWDLNEDRLTAQRNVTTDILPNVRDQEKAE